MPAIYTRGGDTLNENILLKIFAFDDSASDARTPCIAKEWEKLRRGPPMLICIDTNDRPRRRELDLYGLGSGIRKTEFSPDGSLLAVVGSNSNVALYDVATATPRLVPRRVPPS